MGSDTLCGSSCGLLCVSCDCLAVSCDGLAVSCDGLAVSCDDVVVSCPCYDLALSVIAWLSYVTLALLCQLNFPVEARLLRTSPALLPRLCQSTVPVTAMAPL